MITGLLYLPGKKEVVGLQVEDLKNSHGKTMQLKRLACKYKNSDRVVDMGNLYAFKDKQERKVIREVAKITEEYMQAVH